MRPSSDVAYDADGESARSAGASSHSASVSSLSDGSAVRFADRFTAWFIDALILFAAQWLLFIVLARQLQAVGMQTVENCGLADVTLQCRGPSTGAWTVLFIMWIGLTIGYHVWFDGRIGATPGKRFVGLRVRSNAADTAGPLGFGASVARACIRQLPWLSLVLVLDVSPLSLNVGSVGVVAVPLVATFGLIMGAVLPSGSAAHDVIAGTTVVRADHDSELIDVPAAGD